MRLKSLPISLYVVGSLCSHVHIRKSLSYAPILPHARYITEPPLIHLGYKLSSDPYEIATDYIKAIHSDTPSLDFYIRDDSYTDLATGLHFIYARQRLNEVDVTDGDINLVIGADGEVLSYGDSVSISL